MKQEQTSQLPPSTVRYPPAEVVKTLALPSPRGVHCPALPPAGKGLCLGPRPWKEVSASGLGSEPKACGGDEVRIWRDPGQFPLQVRLSQSPLPGLAALSAERDPHPCLWAAVPHWRAGKVLGARTPLSRFYGIPGPRWRGGRGASETATQSHQAWLLTVWTAHTSARLEARPGWGGVCPSFLSFLRLVRLGFCYSEPGASLFLGSGGHFQTLMALSSLPGPRRARCIGEVGWGAGRRGKREGGGRRSVSSRAWAWGPGR